MRDTQIESYDAIIPKLGERRSAVLAVIQKSPSALWEICGVLGWPVNRVSGRVTELCELGHIADSGMRRINPASGKKAIVWSVVCHGQQSIPLPGMRGIGLA